MGKATKNRPISGVFADVSKNGQFGLLSMGFPTKSRK